MRTTKPNVKRWKWGGPNTSWVIDGLRDENGKRKRRFFPSRDSANEWLVERRPELRDQGRVSLGMTDRQRVDAVRAISILAPLGASLTSAAEMFAERAKLLERTVSFAVLRKELVDAKRADGKSAEYVCDLSHRLARVGKDFDERQVATIEPREIDDWLRALGMAPISRVNFRKILHTTFGFAVARGYARENPVEKTEKIKADHAVPGILTPKEIVALLEVADRRIVPAIAIAAFSGLRDAEIGRMSWDRIDLAAGYVRVDAAIAKTSSRRLIPISKNLRAWLAPFVQKEGRIRGADSAVQPLYLQAKREAVAALEKEGEAAPNLKNWPHNALRHSFASYRMALIANAAQVADECGHSVQIMKQHYRELVTKNDAKQWFAVIPNGDTSNVVAFARRAAVKTVSGSQKLGQEEC